MWKGRRSRRGRGGEGREEEDRVGRRGAMAYSQLTFCCSHHWKVVCVEKRNEVRWRERRRKYLATDSYEEEVIDWRITSSLDQLSTLGKRRKKVEPIRMDWMNGWVWEREEDSSLSLDSIQSSHCNDSVSGREEDSIQSFSSSFLFSRVHFGWLKREMKWYEKRERRSERGNCNHTLVILSFSFQVTIIVWENWMDINWWE